MPNVRFLTHEDIDQLRMILEDYKSNEIKHANPIYRTSNLITHADWIYEQFLIKSFNDFKIVGRFDNAELTQIMVGYNLEVAWGRTNITNVFPHWSMGLLYFKNKQWKSPSENFQQLANTILTSFEKDGYTKFYTVQKLPVRMMKEEDLNSFFSKDKYFKTLLFQRYVPIVENIFMNQLDIDNYKFTGIKAILPRSIHRPIMLLSATRLITPNRS